MKNLVGLGRFLLCIVFIYSLYTPQAVWAAVDIPSYVRVGLEYRYKNVNKIDVNNKELFMGYDIKGEFVPETIFESDSGFSVLISESYFVSINQYFDTYEEAQMLSQKFNDLGINAFPASLGFSRWSVYLEGVSSYSEAETISSKANSITNIDFIIKEPNTTRTILKNKYETIAVFEGEEAYPQFSGVGSDSTVEIIELGDRKYRGRMEFGRYTGSGITAVNIVPFDEYLYGVVPAEMPSSWHMEALKAQAVVTRNYAMLSMGKHKNSGYDLCDQQHCQVYKGYEVESSSSNEAVDQTKEELLYYDNELINTFYFSSSGGYTENSENVWMMPLPYLKAVPDPYETNPKVWSKSFSKKQIEDLLKNTGKDIGDVVDLQIDSYTPSGRVKELNIIGTKGYESLTKESIRTFFKINGVSLESRMFEIIKGGSGISSFISAIGSSKISQNISGSRIAVVGADTKTETISFENSSINVQTENGVKRISFTTSTPVTGDFVFQGRGFGHGVGMSQWGAKGMAEQGYNYKQILSYYYTGTAVH